MGSPSNINSSIRASNNNVNAVRINNSEYNVPQRIGHIVAQEPALQATSQILRAVLGNLLTLSLQYEQDLAPRSENRRRVYQQMIETKNAFIDGCHNEGLDPVINEDTYELTIFEKINEEVLRKLTEMNSPALASRFLRSASQHYLVAGPNAVQAAVNQAAFNANNADNNNANNGSSAYSSSGINSNRSGGWMSPAARRSQSLLVVPQAPPAIPVSERVTTILAVSATLSALSEAGKTLLHKLFADSLESRMISGPVTQRKRELMDVIRQDKAYFTELCEAENIALAVDDGGEPVVFDTINEAVFAEAAVAIEAQKRQLVLTARPGINLAGMAPAAFKQLYDACLLETTTVRKVQAKILELINNAQLPQAERDRYNVLALRFTNSEAVRYQLSIEGGDVLMGYSLYDLLLSAGVIQRGTLYEGAKVFNLTQANLTSLDEYLTELLKWKDDFTQIIGDLLAVDDPSEYVTTGQKLQPEMAANPINMGRTAVAQLRAMPRNSVCVLLNQVSLNITNHPKRDFIKAKLEGFYALENMIGANGLPKRFLDLDPYRTNINPRQLQQICPRLNRLLKFQQLMHEFTGQVSLDDGIKELMAIDEETGQPVYGYTNELEVMRDYKRGVLFETYRSILGDRTPHNTMNFLGGSLQQVISNAPNSIDLLETRSKDLCEGLLRDHTGVHFKRQEAGFVPTPQQIRALYNHTTNNPNGTQTVTNEMMTVYTGDVRHKNMVRLFATLKNAPAIRAKFAESPNYEQQLNELQTVLVRRLHAYSGLDRHNGHYSQQTVDRAVEHFEHYVANIVYIDQSQVSEASIERSLVELFGNDWADVGGRCATGLDGRILALLTALTTNVGADLHSNLVQFQRECLDGAFNDALRRHGHGESSMMSQGRAEASEFLGITPSQQQRTYATLSYNAKRVVDQFFAARYTPVAVYHKARTFFGDAFWQLNEEQTDENNEQVYNLLESLGFPGSHDELDRLYRVNGDPEKGWQYAYFQQDLPKYLVSYLVKEKFLIVKEGDERNILFQVEGQERYEVEVEPIELPPQLAQANNNNNNNNVPVQQQPQGGQGGNGFGQNVQSAVAVHQNTGG